MTDDEVIKEQPLPRKLGHYEATEKIGQGGMAVVYKGVQQSLNRPVAIKVLPTRLARTEELVERFDREASVVAQLNHPNIVQVIDRGKEGDTLFIVMEYVPSSSLDAMIQRDELSLEQTMHYAAQICDGLEYAHSKGVIHRDLKPSNILIDNDSGRAKIADFGIAGIDTSGTGMSTLTTDGAAMGTINYMSPEQRLDSHRVTHLTDIFSFGVLLYEMLTRKLPIGHFKLPSIINQSVPIGLDTIVKKCLEESPNDRYQSATAIKHDLERITTRHVTLKKAAAFTSRSVWSGKRRYIAGGLGVAALIAVVLTLALRGPVEGNHLPDTNMTSVLYPQPGGPDTQPAEPPIQPKPKPTNTTNATAKTPVDSAHTQVNLCRVKWQKLPLHGTANNQRDAEAQKKLIASLQKIIAEHPKSTATIQAYQLIAEIAARPDLNDWKTTADSLIWLYTLDRSAGADVLFRAGELYHRRVKNNKRAVAAYELFLKDFPNERRAGIVTTRLKTLKK